MSTIPPGSGSMPALDEGPGPGPAKRNLGPAFVEEMISTLVDHARDLQELLSSEAGGSPGTPAASVSVGGGDPRKTARAALDDPMAFRFDTAGYPPMLCAALNEPLQQKPEPNPQSYASFSDAELSSILRWISARLNEGLGDPWSSEAGNPGRQRSDTDPDERWARLVTEMLFGIQYAGPGVQYFGDAAFDEYIYRRITPGFGGEPQFGSDGRLSRRATGRLEFGQREGAPNVDPAYSLIGACQHVATYGVLTRGHDWHTSMGGAGLGASRGARSKPLFYRGTGSWRPETFAVHDYGGVGTAEIAKSVETDQSAANEWLSVARAASAPGFGPGSVYVFDADRGLKCVPFALYQHPEDSTAAPAAPGAAWNAEPTWGTLPRIDGECLLRPLLMRCINDKAAGKKPPFDPIQLHIFLLHERANASSRKDHSGSQIWRPSAWSNPARPDRALRAPLNAEQERAGVGDNPALELCNPAKLEENRSKTTPFTWELGGIQRQGAHVQCVLRTSVDRARVQLLNTSISLNFVAPDLAQVRARMLVAGRGLTTIGDGKLSSNVGGPRDFVGIGIPDPGSENLDAAINALRHARPVGVCRLVLRHRDFSAQDDRVLYISHPLPMWGPSPTQNYTIARLCWSLRDLPGGQDIEALWLIYQPTDRLAWRLWRSGARGISWAAFADELAKRGDGKVELNLIRVAYNSAGGQCVLTDPNDAHVDQVRKRLKSAPRTSQVYSKTLTGNRDPVAFFDPEAPNPSPDGPAEDANPNPPVPDTPPPAEQPPSEWRDALPDGGLHDPDSPYSADQYGPRIRIE